MTQHIDTRAAHIKQLTQGGGARNPLDYEVLKLMFTVILYRINI